MKKRVGAKIIAPLGAFPKSLGFCSGDPESSLAEIFDFCPKKFFSNRDNFFTPHHFFTKNFLVMEHYPKSPKTG